MLNWLLKLLHWRHDWSVIESQAGTLLVDEDDEVDVTYMIERCSKCLKERGVTETFEEKEYHSARFIRDIMKKYHEVDD